MRNHGIDAVSTSGIYWQEKGPFTQPLRTPKTVLWRRELRATPLRSMAPRAKVFTSEAGELFEQKNKKLETSSPIGDKVSRKIEPTEQKIPVNYGRD